MDKKLEKYAAIKENCQANWKQLTQRHGNLANRPGDIRSPFARDYTRILHSMAYRRLKHKTQVFFNIDNDHICTRMEHVAHVESVSYTISNCLGLNTELTKAIAIGHDLGHAPFGHHGETVLTDIMQKYLSNKSDDQFWHERNGLRFVDKVELLKNSENKFDNLCLTYAVRDGIISHCGEKTKQCIHPRDNFIDLELSFTNKGQYEPITWEGCVVKVSDIIAYLGRDIEDAMNLGFIDEEGKQSLRELADKCLNGALNTTRVIHNLILDVCNSSSFEKGICFSNKGFDSLLQIKDFNYQYIYKNERLESFKNYAILVINELFKVLLSTYKSQDTFSNIFLMKKYYPKLMHNFACWLAQYVEPSIIPASLCKDLSVDPSACLNEKIYGKLDNKEVFIQAIIDYIAGMTDRFAVEMFNELISY